MRALATLASLYTIFAYGLQLQPVVALANRHRNTTGIMDSINFPTKSNPRYHKLKKNPTNDLNVNRKQRWTVNIILSVGNPGNEQRTVHNQGVLVHPKAVLISYDCYQTLTKKQGEIFVKAKGKYIKIFQVSHSYEKHQDGSIYSNAVVLKLSEPVLGKKPISIATEDDQFRAGSICRSISGTDMRYAKTIVVHGTDENKFIYTESDDCSHSVPEDHYEILVCPSGKGKTTYVLASLTKMSHQGTKRCQIAHQKIGLTRDYINRLMKFIESETTRDQSTIWRYNNF